ncbi:hypothetical protein JCM11491_006105 [Sporobolomyces phaffii]
MRTDERANSRTNELGAALASASSDRLRSLKKRQTLSGDATQQVQGLLTLFQQVLTDQQSGNLTAACTSWAGSLSQCEGSAGQNQVALASCACAASTLGELNSCATSYGTTGTTAASGFESFCANTLPSIAQTGLTSTVGARLTSSSSEAASSAPSALSSVQSALASSASSIVSAASSAAASASASSSSAPRSSATPSTGATSSAEGKAKAGTIQAAALGLVSFVAVALL